MRFPYINQTRIAGKMGIKKAKKITFTSHNHFSKDLSIKSSKEEEEDK